MSRKTAVCVLFALFLSVAGTSFPAHAASWTGADSPTSTSTGDPTGGTTQRDPAMDPDGLAAPAPALPGGLLAQLIRLLLGALVV